MTLNDIRNSIMQKCGQFDANGVKSNGTVNEYDKMIPILADEGQRELLDIAKISTTNTTYTYHKTNSTSNITVEHGCDTNGTLVITLDGSANNVAVTAGQTVTQVATAINAVLDALANYSSAVGGASNSVVTITHAIAYADDMTISYNVGNTGVELVTGQDEYVKVTDITNMGGLISIIDQTDGGFVRNPVYNVVNGKDIYVLNSFKGTLLICYTPAPTALTLLTDALIIDDNTAIQALTFYIASMLLLEDNPALSNFYTQKYVEQKRELRDRSPAFEEQIADIYDTSCGVS